MSLFTYNSITLPYPYHSNFSQEVGYDQSGTDKIYTRYDIAVSSILNVNYLNVMGVTDTSTPAMLMQKIKARLLQPRRTLSIIVGGVDIIPPAQSGNQGSVDAKNGPQPQYCEITQLTNETFLINYRIIAHYWENLSIAGNTVTNQQGGAILCNRWVEGAVINDCLFSVRTRKGSFTIRSDNAQGFTVDDMRESACLLGVPPGFLRKKASFATSPDGLTVEYDIEDMEVFKMPPAPAYKAEGKYTEYTSLGPKCQSGYVRTGTAEVVLYGSKTTDQGALISTALSVVTLKLGLVGSITGDTNYQKGKKGVRILPKVVLNSCLTIDMYNNIVGFSATAKFKPLSKGNIKVDMAGVHGLLRKAWTITPLSDPNVQPSYSLRGTAGVFLEACAYVDPSLNNYLNDSKFGDGLIPGQAGKSLEPATEAESNSNAVTT